MSLAAPDAASDIDRLVAAYPALAGLEPELAPLLLRLAQVPRGTPLFSEGQPCQGFPLLLEGEVRVARRSPDGRALELYRITPGELCLVSSACLFRGQALPAHAVAARPTALVLVPPADFQRWLERPAFRDFVLGLYAERMADLTAVIDAVAFQRLDQRLAAALLGHGPELEVTHQQLADAVGTVREMVTRLLRRFEREGWLTLGREHIRLLDSASLRRLAEGVEPKSQTAAARDGSMGIPTHHQGETP